MASFRYSIFETASFLKEARNIVGPSRETLLVEKIRNRVYPKLKEEPHYGSHIKKLKGYEPESWRYRIGDLRLFYSIDEVKKVVIITAIRLRKDAYR